MRGRDLCDVALATTFGPNAIEGFRGWTDEVAAVADRTGRQESAS
ncbi:MAG: hypothetical protein JWQ03_1050 [Variovorax sp.]|nr:hypothetical protein [Variovorax sp.]